MKNLFWILFSIAVLCAGCSSDSGDDNEKPQEELQIALYDKNKEAVVYIAYSEDSTIYTFEGEPVAFIELEEQVYGFNGKFLGWYWDGVLYDMTYRAVAAKHGIVRGGINTVSTFPERVKGVKQLEPLRPVRELAFVRPVLYDSWSETSLTDFFAAGKK